MNRTTDMVLDVPIDVMSWEQCVERLMRWSRERSSRAVMVCNVHVVVTASRDSAYGKIISGADMACPDGAPVAWVLRRLGHRTQHRITGPDLMWALCERCARDGIPIYFYGSQQQVLESLQRRLLTAFPGLPIAGVESPPFRPLAQAEDDEAVRKINASGACIVFVGLGCPKQEQWIDAHRGRISAPMIGVGAAFDFHAGTKSRAPHWMQRKGLEWLHRLFSEPKRLGPRYFITNSLFVAAVVRRFLFRAW